MIAFVYNSDTKIIYWQETKSKRDNVSQLLSMPHTSNLCWDCIHTPREFMDKINKGWVVDCQVIPTHK